MLPEKISNIEEVCFARRYVVLDGRAAGERVIEVHNGRLSFTVLESRALDLHSFRHKGTNLSFICRNGLGTDNGFANSFNGGMLYTCGLETVGARALPVHGSIHNLPADVSSVNYGEDGVEIVGFVRQSELFGKNLLFRRRIYTEVNSEEVTIETEICNEGYTDAEYCVLFHMNVGYPMLDDGVCIQADVRSTQPRTPWAAKNVATCFTMENPLANTEEQVFFHRVNNGNVTVINKKLGKKMTFTYDSEMLPHLIEWKSMVSGSYALGIEPSTTTLDGDFERKKIAAGETHRYVIKIKAEDIN